MSMKSKSKISTSKKRKLKVRLLKSQTTSANTRIVSQFEKKIIETLYQYALKKKSTAEIVLSEIEHSEMYKAKIKVLDNLKQKGIIKKYTLLKPEEIEFQPSKPRRPSKLEVEVNPDILLQQIPDEYDEAYLCNASIEFDPKIIIKYYKKICHKEMVEKGFTNEIKLICNELRFGLETGNVIYRDTVANFRPGSKEYNLLKEFLEHLNRRRSTQQLLEVIYPGKNVSQRKDYFKKVKWFVDSVRKKLEMYGPKPKNEDLFEACNGYRIKYRKK